MKSVELFAGIGGLGMGCELAGFATVAAIEWNKWACATLRENVARGFPLVREWRVHEGDVRDFDWSGLGEDIDLVSGGPPCQPFSLGGKHRAQADRRDMFPAAVECVRRLRPRAFIFENVKGLARASFADYFRHILARLEHPAQAPRAGESWESHARRLRLARGAGESSAPRYRVVPTLVNAADHGVPQRRERLFIVGLRADLDVAWTFPRPRHSLDALLHDQWVTGEYWRRHGIARPAPPARFTARVRALARAAAPETRPWRTVRDALAGLPEPDGETDAAFADHRLQPGARVYPGHTGSPLDLPAKTLKAGDHGVPGGENMLVRDDGTVRYFSARESARLQTFPDDFKFHGAWSEAMRQIGNAVPVALAWRVAASVAASLDAADGAPRKTRRRRDGAAAPLI